MKIKIIAAVIMIQLALGARAFAGSAGTEGMLFLKIAPGARFAAMGEAGCAGAGTLEAAYFNPAGLALIDKLQAGGTHIIWFGDVAYDFMGIAGRIRDVMTAGAHGILLRSSDTKRSGKWDLAGEDFGITNRALVLSLAFDLNGALALGINIKNVYQQIDSFTSSGNAIDAGVLFSPLKRLRLGAVMQNLGTEIKMVNFNEQLPLVFKTGASLLLFDGKLMVVADYGIERRTRGELSAGGEFRAGPLSLRGGYRHYLDKARSSREGYTAGCGLSLKNFRLDYAYVPFGGLGSVHRLSIIYGR